MRKTGLQTFLLITFVFSLSLSFFLPSVITSVEDHHLCGQTIVKPLSANTVSDQASVSVCDMLRIVSHADSGIPIQQGRCLSSEEAFYQAVLDLKYLSEKGLPVETADCLMQSCTPVYLIDSADFSRRIILWSVEILCSDKTMITLYLDDNTGMILGLTCRWENDAVSKAGLGASELTDLFIDYWGITQDSISLITAGKYLISVSDNEKEQNIEFPLSVIPHSFSINME